MISPFNRLVRTDFPTCGGPETKNLTFRGNLVCPGRKMFYYNKTLI